MRNILPRNSLANAVVRLFRQINRIHNKTLKDLGLSALQAHILVILWLEGPLTIGELQAILSLGGSTLTGAIDRMEKAGLARRMPVSGDRRAFLLEPADWDQARREEVFDALAAAEEACFVGLNPEEREELLRLLVKATAALDRFQENP